MVREDSEEEDAWDILRKNAVTMNNKDDFCRMYPFIHFWFKYKLKNCKYTNIFISSSKLIKVNKKIEIFSYLKVESEFDRDLSNGDSALFPLDLQIIS